MLETCQQFFPAMINIYRLLPLSRSSAAQAGLQAIHFAAKKGCLEVVQRLLDAGASVNSASAVS